MLQDLPQLCLEYLSFKNFWMTYKFVITINGSLKRPQFIYDPQMDGLFTLLEDLDYFPINSYSKSNVLDILLKTFVSSNTIFESTHHIESLMHKDQVKASSFLGFICSHIFADVSCRLLLSTDLVFNDVPWLLDSKILLDGPMVSGLIHPSLFDPIILKSSSNASMII